MTGLVVTSRMRTPLILALNFTFTPPWPDMTRGEQADALQEIAACLQAEIGAIGREIGGAGGTLDETRDEAPSGPLWPLGGLFAGLRPGVAYTVLRAPDGPSSALVALTDHADAEIGEWAIFRGWGTTLQSPPSRIVTAPARNELRFFASPQRVAGFLVYQRVAPEGDEIFTVGDTTPTDEAAAARA